MARYIDEILQPGEQVLYSTNAHWIFYFPAILAWAVVVAVPALFCTVKGWFHRMTTETDVTNPRVVHKTGFIKRRTFEIALDKIESVDVNQSIMGRVLNYGDVTILGVGEGKENIATIAAPLSFRNAITAH